MTLYVFLLKFLDSPAVDLDSPAVDLDLEHICFSNQVRKSQEICKPAINCLGAIAENDNGWTSPSPHIQYNIYIYICIKIFQ